MITAALKHSLGHDVTLYLAWAYTINSKYARLLHRRGGEVLNSLHST
jgi:hypothetical protein